MTFLGGLALMLAGVTATIFLSFWLHRMFGSPEQKEVAKDAFAASRRMGVLGTLAFIAVIMVAVIGVKFLMLLLAMAITGTH